MQEQNDQSSPRTPGLLRLVIPFLGSDYIEILVFLIRMIRRVFSVKVHEGMYEVLELDSSLELLDNRGEQAILHKREKVKFLQDDILAYQDTAWGDGNIFEDYKCSPGKAVDTYREGNRFNILISLRQTKHRGDVEQFLIERQIKSGFTKEVEDFQSDIDHTTRRLTLTVTFPKERTPKVVTIIEHNLSRSTPLGEKSKQTLPDGRQQWVWSTDHPRLFEAYIMRWEW